MSEPKSPLPWLLSGQKVIATHEGRECSIAFTFDGDGPHDDYVPLPGKGNAEYIVHSANTYPKLVAMLKGHEWADHGDNPPSCGFCGRYRVDGHGPDCELAALLKECEE